MVVGVVGCMVVGWGWGLGRVGRAGVGGDGVGWLVVGCGGVVVV